MNILSLFDGMSCGRIALDRAGVAYNNYFASEIDKHAIKVAQFNYPDTKQLGSVTEIRGKDLPKIGLLLAGSPCQGFSFAGKQLNFKDARSVLFFEFVRILEETKPKYFLLENVVMKKEYSDVISGLVGVEPILINSNLVSAQNRKRLYWTNIPGVQQPEDRGVFLRDIISTSSLNPAAIRGRRLNNGTIVGRRLNSKGIRVDEDKRIPIVQCLEVRETSMNKSNCLTTVKKDNVLTPLPAGRYKDAFSNKYPFRYYTVEECCRLQTVPEYYLKKTSESQARKMLGNGWTIDVIAHILKGIQ